MTAGNNTLSFTRGRGEDKTPTLGLCFSFRSDWTNMGQVSVPSPITATRGMLGSGSFKLNRITWLKHVGRKWFHDRSAVLQGGRGVVESGTTTSSVRVG